MAELRQGWVCGFWRRLAALVIDTLVLGAIGYVLGIFMFDTLVQLGARGKMIGFLISFTYFGVMGSWVGGGQTIGKRLLKIKVVDAEGTAISLPKSFLRYSVLAVPFWLNGAQLGDATLMSYLMYPLSLVIVGGMSAILYLYIFNRRTRQSLHDLLVGSFVVNSRGDEEVLSAIWRPHLVVVAGLFIAAAAAPALTSDMVQTPQFKSLLDTQSAVSRHPAVQYASVNEGSRTINSSNAGSQTTTYFSAQAILKINEVENSDLAKQLARAIMTSHPEAIKKDMIQVKLTYGYSLGIVSKWNSYVHSFQPDELSEIE